MQLTGTTIRVACNQARTSDFVNAIGNQAPIIPKTGSVTIPCAVFIDDPTLAANLLTDLSNVVTANLVMRSGSAAGAVLFQQVIAAGSFNAGLTYAQWAAGTAAHFTFTLTPTDTNISANPLWIAIGLTTTNAGDIPLVFCAKAQIKDYGIFNAAAPTAPDYTSWSKAEADGRYAQAANVSTHAPQITGATGGGATNLDGIATANLPNYYALWIRRIINGNNVPQLWYLEPVTDPLNGAAEVVPPDFNAATNPRHFRQRL